MTRVLLAVTLFGLIAALVPSTAQAHCQVPCGIYDDHARIHALREHITTIGKAVTNLKTLAAKSDAQSINQRIRWTNAKEDHAEKIIRTISDYFLTQKIKPVAASDKKGRGAYLVKLAEHHAVMRAAMKCKQTVSPETVKALTQAVDAIEKYWPKK